MAAEVDRTTIELCTVWTTEQYVVGHSEWYHMVRYGIGFRGAVKWLTCIDGNWKDPNFDNIHSRTRALES